MKVWIKYSGYNGLWFRSVCMVFLLLTSVYRESYISVFTNCFILVWFKFSYHFRIVLCWFTLNRVLTFSLSWILLVSYIIQCNYLTPPLFGVLVNTFDILVLFINCFRLWGSSIFVSHLILIFPYRSCIISYKYCLGIVCYMYYRFLIFERRF